MSRLTDLIIEAKKLDPGLGTALESEMHHLQERRAFGLNFERHTPEAVDLYGRPVRKGDKVRMLPPRGETTIPDTRIWLVTGRTTQKGVVIADLTDPKTNEAAVHPLGDLVVVAEQNDVIYPGLVSTGKVERGGDKPFHTVINSENLHALKALMYTHKGKIDCIYIDPPYNTGAKDWKYNNDYVEGDDLYRHSKWLAFLERRLLIARELLNPENSVLIVTIDEKEYLRLGLLLEQLFPECQIEMVTSIMSAKGVARVGQFSRVEEYIFFVRLGDATIPLAETNMLDSSRSAASSVGQPIEWLGLRRREPTARRGARPNQFYPVFVSSKSGFAHSIGDPVPNDVDRTTIESKPDTFAVWPLLPNGTEGLWGITPDTARAYLNSGYLRARRASATKQTASIHYLPSGTVKAIEEGAIEIIGHEMDGTVIAVHRQAKGIIPKRVWNMPSHNSETSGSALLNSQIPGRRFPFPKSLFAVEDALRFAIIKKPTSIVLDFFSGSGTTANAVMRLNKQDGGRRQSISITNNEVASDEQRFLRQQELRPGDSAWEELGICDYITKPRLKAAITGHTPDGDPIRGDYKFTDEFPMADGFEENAEFFTLTYGAPLQVASNLSFEHIAALLWLRAGATGRRIESLADGWEVAHTYGVIDRLECLDAFIDAIVESPAVRLSFIVTDDNRRFQAACAALPEGVEPIRLYESYLRNFQIDAQRSTR